MVWNWYRSFCTTISQILEQSVNYFILFNLSNEILVLFVDIAGSFQPQLSASIQFQFIHKHCANLNTHTGLHEFAFHVKSLSTVLWCWNLVRSPLSCRSKRAWSLLACTLSLPFLFATEIQLHTNSISPWGGTHTHTSGWLLWQCCCPVPASHGRNGWRAAGLHVIAQQRLCTKCKVTQISAWSREGGRNRGRADGGLESGGREGGRDGGSESPNYQATVTGCAYAPETA